MNCWNVSGTRPLLTHTEWFNLFNSDGQMLDAEQFYNYLLECKYCTNMYNYHKPWFTTAIAIPQTRAKHSLDEQSKARFTAYFTFLLNSTQSGRI